MRVEVDKYIVIDTEICHGKPTFKGTRIMVWQVSEMLKIGYSFEDIVKEFPSLTVDHVKAALDFAAKKAAGERPVTA
ncbi:MAG: DUF433 domain-containing protein, partial [Nitrososphaeria archaeon]